MPPSLDVYVLSRHRDRPTIERFLDTFVNRLASEERGDEELMLVPLGLPRDDVDKVGGWDWEPAGSLSRIVSRGLDSPARAFTVYLTAADTSMDQACITFTLDTMVVFGLSIDDAGAKPENVDRAKAILHDLADRFDSERGIVVVEQPPPLHRLDFDDKYDPKFVLYSWDRGTSRAGAV